MTHTLVLLRHGQSEFNDQNLFCGWIDVNLTPKGREQAKRASILLQKESIYPQLTYCSKLKRTCQTTNIILEQLSLDYVDVIKNWKFNERHYGSFQGLNKSQVLSKYGKDQYMFYRRAYNGKPPDIDPKENANLNILGKYDGFELPKSESLKDVVERIEPILFNDVKRELIDNNKTVLIVAHGSTIRAILKILKRINDQDIKDLNIPNSIPMVLTIDDDFNIIQDRYLDPSEAEKNSELVRREGFTK